MAATSAREDPLIAFRFVVECNDIEVGFFTECSGLKAEVEVFEYQEGGLNDYVHKLPGRRKWTNITLQRGITSSLDLWKWYQKVVAKNTTHRQSMSIILYSPDGERIMQWNLRGAYPVNWEGPAMKSDGNTVVVEKLELAHNGFDVLNP
jgi:phage tail-like protein